MTVTTAAPVLQSRESAVHDAHYGVALVQELQGSVMRFSLAWLAVANLVGVLLAVLLVCPRCGEWLGQFSYGRWVAVHLNWQLYGWCSLPMAGALLRHFLFPERAALNLARQALWVWSVSLALGGLGWLTGRTSGKLFLDWTGLPLILFVCAMLFLWGVLVWNYLQWDCAFRRSAVCSASRISRFFDIGILAGLFFVPWAIYWAGGRKIYPSVDPGTGGPTGASLLGSTLGIVLIMAAVPWLLRVPRNPGGWWKPFWACFAAECAIWAAVSHGNSSHLDWRQSGALGSLVLWVPLLPLYWSGFEWNGESRLWLIATGCWWALLVVTGIVAFLPGVLERIKFTHILVAHSHLAMAGFLTNANMLVLLNISKPEDRTAKILACPFAFFAWQAGLALHLTSLLAIAAVEIGDPERWFMGNVTALLWMRLGAGAIMAATSMYWVVGVHCIGRPGRTAGEVRG